MRFKRYNCSAVLVILSLTSSLSAAPQEDTPGTRAYFETYIEGRYGYTNGVMRRLSHINKFGYDVFNAQQINCLIVQKIDSGKLLIGIKQPLHWTFSEDYSYYGVQVSKQVPAILIVEDSAKYTEGETISRWVKPAVKYSCETTSGKTLHMDAYRTPVPNTITFEQYETLFKANAKTPDRIETLVSCTPLSSATEYKYTVTNGQAIITGINKEFFGKLSITNTLGGGPVTAINNYAFSSCKTLYGVTIPSSITNITDRAFYGCPVMMSINVDQNNNCYSSIDGILFNKTQTSLIQCPNNKAGSITIPDTVTNLAAGAFSDCKSLTSVTIPASVTKLQLFTFSQCSRLSSIYFKGDAPKSSVYFNKDARTTIYYLPGTKGWEATFGGCPTKIWQQ